MSHYCIVKRGLEIGLMSAMLVHAAGESSLEILPPETRAVALSAEDWQMEFVIQKLEVARVAYHRIEEDGELLAIGIEPATGAKLKAIKKATSSLPLIR